MARGRIKVRPDPPDRARRTPGPPVLEARAQTRIALEALHVRAPDLEHDPREIEDAGLDGPVKLPLSDRAVWEERLGLQLDHVRVRPGLSAEVAARSVGAAAFTHGTDVVLGVESPAVLAHELAHVAYGGDEIENTEVIERGAEHAARLVAGPGSVPAPGGDGPPVVRRVVLGRVPEGAEPDEQGIIWTVPVQSTPRGMLRELQTWVRDELADEVRRNAITEDQRRELRAQMFFVVFGEQARLYNVDLEEIGAYELLEEPSINPGYYLDAGAEFWAPATVDGEFQFLPIEQRGERSRTTIEPMSPFLEPTAMGGAGFEITSGGHTDRVTGMSEWLSDHGAAMRAELSRRGAQFLFLAIPPRRRGGGRRFHWGERRHRELEAALARAFPPAPELGAEEREPDTERPPEDRSGDEHRPPPPPAPPRDRPDRVVYWTSEDAPYVNVWVDGAVRAVRIREGDTVDELTARVRRTAEELRDARDPERSTRVESSVEHTGFTEGGSSVPVAPEVALPFGDRSVNAPAYPARIINHGPDITVVGATNSFTMELDYSPAGGMLIDQVLARMQNIHFYWELVDVTGVPDPPDVISRRTLAGAGDQVGRGSGVARDLERDMEAIGEDTVADLEDIGSGHPAVIAATWPARQAYLSIVGISNVIRIGGSLISAFFSIVTQPRNEQSIGWSETGDFLLRCVATPDSEEGDAVVRASSVATTVVRVQNLNLRATEENDRTLAEIALLREQLAELAEGPERDRIDARIRALERAERITVGTSVAETLSSTEEQIRVARELEAANSARTPRTERSAAVRLLHAQLELMGIALADYIRDLEAQRDQIRALQQRSRRYDDYFGAREYRPQVTFASEVNGMVTRLIMRLGQHPRSTESRPRWVLADVTTADASTHEGTSSTAGLAGHTAAIRAAFIDFRESAKYGRGTIAIRLPPLINTHLGGTVTIDGTMRSAPGTSERVIQRLQDLATAAEIAGLLIGGPVGIAIGVIGGLAGAIVSAHNLARRIHNRTFEWDFQAIMDITGIVGGVFGVIGPGTTVLRTGPRWVRRVERLQHAIHIFTVVQTGAQVLVIPIQLEMELQAIENDTTLSPGERAARRAEALLRAVRSGVVTTVSAAQMLDAAPPGAPRGETDLAPEARPTHEAAGEAAPVVGDTPPARESPTVTGEPPPREPTREAPPMREPTPEGEAPRRREGGEERGARPATDAEPAPRGNPRLTELNEALGDLAGEVRVVDDPDLRDASARVRFDGDEVVIGVGPDATVTQIRDHLGTARVLRRYRGPLGLLRRLMSRVLSLLRLRAGYGTRGFEAQLEVQKLNEILTRLEGVRALIEERARTLGRDAETEARRREIDAEIESIEQQLAENEALINSYETGRGYVAAYDTIAEAHLQDALARLRIEYPGETFGTSADNVVLPGGREMHPSSVADFIELSTISPPRRDMEVMIDASRALEAAGGDRTALSPEHARALELAALHERLRAQEVEADRLRSVHGVDPRLPARGDALTLLDRANEAARAAAGGTEPTPAQVLDALRPLLASDEARAGLDRMRRGGDERALTDLRGILERSGLDLDSNLTARGASRDELAARRAAYYEARRRAQRLQLEAWGVLDDPEVRAALETAAARPDAHGAGLLSGPLGEAIMRVMLQRRFGDRGHRVVRVMFAQEIAGVSTAADALAQVQQTHPSATAADIFEHGGRFFWERGESDGTVMAVEGSRLRPVALAEAKLGNSLADTQAQAEANRGNYQAVAGGTMHAFERGATRATSTEITGSLELGDIATAEAIPFGPTAEFPEASRLPFSRGDLDGLMADLVAEERARGTP